MNMKIISTRQPVSALLSVLLLASLAAVQGADPRPAKPNFVIILIDDMG